MRRALAIALCGSAVGVAVTSAPAGNRDPVSKLEASPGPVEVTYGQNVALTASLENRESSTFTDVRFRLPIPAGATLQMTNCPQVIPGSPGELVCQWGHQLRAGDTAKVVIVLQTPTTGASPMVASGTWSIKEGAQNKGAPDTFPTNPPLSVPLILANDARKAGGFATTVCTNPASPTIATNQVLGSGNPLATSICAPNLATHPFPGLVTAINERNHAPADQGVSQVSDICLPAPGALCGSTPFHFSTPGTFTFLIDNTALPQVCSSNRTAHGGGGGGGCQLRKITKVFHDGQLVLSSLTADPRVVSITFNSQQKRTTVVVKSSENGGWDFG